MNPVDYAKCVQAIGNSLRVPLETLTSKLSDWLKADAVTSVTVAFSASPGVTLSKQDFQEVDRACEEIIFLESKRQILLTFLEQRMHVIAPNTMALVGPSICAKLISAAGGIRQLSITPACNIQVLGS